LGVQDAPAFTPLTTNIVHFQPAPHVSGSLELADGLHSFVQRCSRRRHSRPDLQPEPTTHVGLVASRCRIMTPVECIARLCALVPPPRYPLTRFHRVLAPRAKLRPRIVPKLPEGVRAGGTCGAAGASRKTRDKLHDAPAERPPPRDRRGPVVPVGVPVSATMLARTLDGADVPAPNVLSAQHLGRIGGGLLFAATSNVPWATLFARTFDIDVKACARCGARPRSPRRRHRPPRRA
jgi:hypothetical protein